MSGHDNGDLGTRSRADELRQASAAIGQGHGRVAEGRNVLVDASVSIAEETRAQYGLPAGSSNIRSRPLVPVVCG